MPVSLVILNLNQLRGGGTQILTALLQSGYALCHDPSTHSIPPREKGQVEKTFAISNLFVVVCYHKAHINERVSYLHLSTKPFDLSEAMFVDEYA